MSWSSLGSPPGTEPARPSPSPAHHEGFCEPRGTGVMTKPREKSESSESKGIKSRFGPFTIDAARRQLARGTVLVHLTPKAFDLLLLLVREAPRVVSKSELHDRLWPESFVTDASIAELVKEVR